MKSKNILIYFYLFVAVFLANVYKINAQETLMQGEIRYLITHNWVKKMEAVDYISKQRRERLAYMWGNRAEWKLYSTLFFTSSGTRYEDSEERAEPGDEGYSWRKDIYQIKKKFDVGMQYDVMEMLGKVYIVEDSLRAPAWKIGNDLKEVAGHVCMNATWQDTLKMQDVEAWFALDIPVPGGPERFHGLPGMILEIDVNRGAMVVSADRISIRPLGTELDLPKKYKGKKINESDYEGILKRHFKEKREAEEPPFWGLRY